MDRAVRSPARRRHVCFRPLAKRPKNRELLKKDQPTMLCNCHLPPKIRKQLFETGSLSVPTNQQEKDAYWKFSNDSKKTRDTVTKQFFHKFNIFRLFKKQMNSAQETYVSGSCKKSVSNICPFVVKRNSFDIKVLRTDPMVQLERGICDSNYRGQRSAKRVKKAKLEFQKWEKTEQKRRPKRPKIVNVLTRNLMKSLTPSLTRQRPKLNNTQLTKLEISES